MIARNDGWLFGAWFRPGQFDREGDAGAVEVRLGADGAAVQKHDVVNEGQADAQPALTARERLFALDKRLENVRKQLGGDTWPVVAHADFDVFPAGGHGH